MPPRSGLERSRVPQDRNHQRRFAPHAVGEPTKPYGADLHVTLRARLRPLAPGLTPRAVLDKFAAVQMLDVHFPTTDGRTLILSRYTQLTVIVAFYEAYLKEAAIK
jgi:hypothetical protein